MKKYTLLAIGALLLVACTAEFPPLDSVQISCTTNDDCPNGQSCSFVGICMPGAGSDAGVTPPVCEPGSFTDCRCEGGGVGHRVCIEDGTAYGAECLECKASCVGNDDCQADEACVDDVCQACPGGPSAEVCDEIDNDCNGQVDDGLTCNCLDGNEQTINCNPELNNRGEQLQRCEGGQWINIGECVDDDICRIGATRDCGSNIGACHSGTEVCTGTSWAGCQGATLPQEEICGNGSDDNCNGIDDDAEAACRECNYMEWDFGSAEACDTGLPGICASGTQECTPNNQLHCRQEAWPSEELCDGLDNDCDGDVDEDQPVVNTSCGVGACRAVGIRTCVDGIPNSNSCQPLAAGVEIPDGIDNNCDGQVDEGFACDPLTYEPVATVCGEGACASAGLTACIEGQIVDNCQPGMPDGIDSDCDGIDSDCDGQVDEDFVGMATTCGQGACASNGQLLCQGGETVDSCEPGMPVEELCDNIDNNCDGLIDETFADLNNNCEVGIGECRIDGSRQCNADGSGTTCQPWGDQQNPAADDATCNGLDEDCDGQVDEDAPSVPVVCGEGICRRTVNVACVGGGYNNNACIPGDPTPAEICGDELDNDCDGAVDNGCDCLPGNTQPCGSEIGACTMGLQTCSPQGQWGACEGATLPSDELCDGIDNDCDGIIDNDIEEAGEQCEVGIGPCLNEGNIVCDPESGDLVCNVDPLPGQPETCNERDDDCDGEVDEDFNLGTPCFNGLGACRAEGVWECARDDSGIRVCSQEPDLPGPEELCNPDSTGNGIDEDCDGQVDEICGCNPGETQECGQLVGLNVQGACQVGQQTCLGEGSWSGCEGEILPEQELPLCDGIDQDCDGEIDEDAFNACGVCGDLPAESCNGNDDDCNGIVDDGFGVGEYCFNDEQRQNCATGIPGNNVCTEDEQGVSCNGCAPTPVPLSPCSITWGNGSQAFIYTYDVEEGGTGFLTCRSFGNGHVGNNLVVREGDHFGDGQPMRAFLYGGSHSCGEGVLSERWEFAYDAENRLSSITRRDINNDSVRRTMTYSYNDLGMIQSEIWRAENGDFQRRYDYQVDSAGNPTLMTQVNEDGTPMVNPEIRVYSYSDCGLFPQDPLSL